MTAQVQINDTGSTVTVSITEATVGVGIPSSITHSAISGRSAADAHPTSAITGLDAALASKQPLDADLTALASEYNGTTKAFSALQTFNSGLTVSSGTLSAQAVTCTTLTASGTISTSASLPGSYLAATINNVAANGYAQLNFGSGTLLGSINVATGLFYKFYQNGSIPWQFESSSGVVATLTAAGAASFNGTITSNFESNSPLIGRYVGGYLGYTGIRQDATNHNFHIEVYNGGSFLTPLSISQGGIITLRGVSPGSPVGGQVLIGGGSVVCGGPLSCTTLTASGLTSITSSAAMTAPASNAVNITDGKIRCGNTSATSIETAGGVTAAGAYTGTITDTATATQVDGLVISHRSSNTPAAAFGTTIRMQAESTTTDDRNQAVIQAEWVSATDATRTARISVYAYDTAAREVMRGQANGSAPMIGFLGASAVARPSLAAATGTATRTTFDTATVTTSQLAERVKALIDDLRAYGLEG